jgi:nicotinamide mononucleotide transporter
MGLLELAGLVSGVLCVWLLIRENIWTFPVGLVYSFVSVAVFANEKLYADVLLSGYYVLMNGYGWYYWLHGDDRENPQGGNPDSNQILPIHCPRRTATLLVPISVLGIAGMGWFFDTRTEAALPYWDSATTILSFVAMWMTARKYLENWGVWWLVNLLAIGIYRVKGIELYAVLYAVYLVMSVFGWRAWRRSMIEAPG